MFVVTCWCTAYSYWYKCDLLTFSCFCFLKAVHIARPEQVEEGSLHLLPSCLPGFQGIALPETGNKINLSMGVPRCNFHKVPEDLKSSDPTVVANYMNEHFKAFTLVDYNDFAHQWVNQNWNRTGQVHCNFYHSTELGIVLMGDACHATSPSIGMGMNTSLRDAQTFYQLLKEHNDDFNIVLPKYSQLRVKEGNSLSDLALHLYCFDTTAQIIETIHTIARSFLHKLFPSLVGDHPANLIGLAGYDLSDCYEHAVNCGIINKHRRINDKMRRDYFERECGMIKKPKSSNVWIRNILTTIVLSLGVALVAFLIRKTGITKYRNYR
jgi:FAD binding domain